MRVCIRWRFTSETCWKSEQCVSTVLEWLRTLCQSCCSKKLDDISIINRKLDNLDEIPGGSAYFIVEVCGGYLNRSIEFSYCFAECQWSTWAASQVPIEFYWWSPQSIHGSDGECERDSWVEKSGFAWPLNISSCCTSVGKKERTIQN